MSDHELVWTHDNRSVDVNAVCHAGPDADCRLTAECDCERWSVERDEQGPFHLSGDYSESARDRHDMKPGGYCNVCAFLNEDPWLLPELFFGPSFEIGRTPIEPVSRGDHYEWKPTAGGESRG